MSKEDIDRFVADLKGNASLLDEAKAVSGGLAAMADFAQSKGYDISVDEAKTYISAKANAELSDSQLDAVAGGKGHHSVATSTFEAAQVVTTAQAAAEVEVAAAAVTIAAEAAEAATTVAVVAEVAVVLT